MAKRSWTVEWRARPMSDGLERLGQAVKLVIDRGALAPRVETNAHDERPARASHASAAALEELDG
jgi:hypothetical protein